MAKHIITLTSLEADRIISGTQQFLFKFFKKRPEFLCKVRLGDLIYFRKSKGEVLGQFEVGKLIILEELEESDWNWVKEIQGKLELKQGEFLEKLKENKTLIIIQIKKLEQFITPPIEIDKRSKREWVVLD